MRRASLFVSYNRRFLGLVMNVLRILLLFDGAFVFMFCVGGCIDGVCCMFGMCGGCFDGMFCVWDVC